MSLAWESRKENHDSNLGMLVCGGSFCSCAHRWHDSSRARRVVKINLLAQPDGGTHCRGLVVRRMHEHREQVRLAVWLCLFIVVGVVAVLAAV